MSDPAAEQNRRHLWNSVAQCLAVAYTEIEHAQAALEDLGLTEHADLLQPQVDALRRASNEAAEAAG